MTIHKDLKGYFLTKGQTIKRTQLYRKVLQIKSFPMQKYQLSHFI